MRMLSEERLAEIRRLEKEYHEICYEKHTLFQAGSWLYKPAGIVLEGLTAWLDSNWGQKQTDVRILDLGCGVGRNLIPMAETIRGKGNSSLVGVDLLESALDKLQAYAQRYGVNDRIETIVSDIGHYRIEPESFDYIVAVSALEHVASEGILHDVLQQIERGTRAGGGVCLILNTAAREQDVRTGEALVPAIELNIETERMLNQLQTIFTDWNLHTASVKPLSFQIERDGKAVQLDSESLTFLTYKN